MKKYFLFFFFGVSEALTSRGSYFYWVLVDVLSVGIMPFLWIAVVAARGEPMHGFGIAELVTYFLGSGVIWQVVVSYPFSRIIQAVQRGDLAHDLVRPYSYFVKIFFLQLGHRVARFVFFLPFFIVIVFFFHRFLLLPQGSTQVAMLFVSLIVAYALIYIFHFIVGMTAFWFDEAEGVVDAALLVFVLFSGDFAPLSFFPSWLHTIAIALPFQYVINFPLQIYLGNIDTIAFVRGIAIAVTWLAVLYGLYIVLWYRGIRLFTGVGR